MRNRHINAQQKSPHNCHKFADFVAFSWSFSDVFVAKQNEIITIQLKIILQDTN